MFIKPVFLRWVLIASLISLGTVVFFVTGVMSEINKADFTKISFAIFAVFILLSAKTGKLTYEACKDGNKERIIEKNRAAWFWSDMFMAAGMVGTIIGFIFMMSGTFDNASSATIQSVIVSALSKMGLALYTTGSGLICSGLLKIQLFNLEQYASKLP